MKAYSKIEWIKAGLIIGYILTLFIPVYAKVINGKVFKVSIVGLNAGTFFLIMSSLLILATIISYFFLQTFHKYMYFSMLGFMFIMLFMLLFLKEDASRIRSAVILQLFLVPLLTIAYFFESLTISFFDKLYLYLKTTVIWIKNQLIRLYQTLKDAKRSKEKVSLETTEGDDPK
ncbi:MAG: hypothetical protein KKH92_09045 [Firmicutes bacterium]|nr:hypothetical protein [Bacillota bacterium]